MIDKETTMQGYITGKLYDFLKRVVQVVLPATATLYFTLASIFEWGNGEVVVGTIAAVTTFLGVVLGISSSNYRASGAGTVGTIDVTETDETKSVEFEFDENFYDLDQQDQVTFRVNRV